MSLLPLLFLLFATVYAQRNLEISQVPGSPDFGISSSNDSWIQQVITDPYLLVIYRNFPNHYLTIKQMVEIHSNGTELFRFPTNSPSSSTPWTTLSPTYYGSTQIYPTYSLLGTSIQKWINVQVLASNADLANFWSHPLEYNSFRTDLYTSKYVIDQASTSSLWLRIFLAAEPGDSLEDTPDYLFIKRPNGTGTKFVWEKTAKTETGAIVSVQRSASGIPLDSDITIPGSLTWEVNFTFVGQSFKAVNWTYYVGPATSPIVCTCSGKSCGSDGCGKSCGECPGVQSTDVCYASVCTRCAPSCSGKSCGPDGCGGTCGSCPSGNQWECQSDGTCLCTRNCSSKRCGDDGCGGVCGVCDNSVYSANKCINGFCQCQGSCNDRFCGDDGCGAVCGHCGDGLFCNSYYRCAPTSCGPSVCAQGCSDCPFGLACNASGVCGCSASSCGGSCGSCGSDREVCLSGVCFCQDATCGGKCCTSTQQCTNGLCVEKSATCPNGCVAPKTCINGVCSCPAETCGESCATCTSPSTCVDGHCKCPENSCGFFCGNCPPPQTCVNNVCVCPTECEGACGVCSGADLDVHVFPDPSSNVTLNSAVNFDVVITNIGMADAKQVSLVVEIPLFFSYKSAGGAVCVKYGKTSDKMRFVYNCTLNSNSYPVGKSNEITIKTKATDLGTSFFRATVSTTTTETLLDNNVNEISVTSNPKIKNNK